MWLLEKIFPEYTWSVKTSEKVIYLTFDDGPIPELTSWVLEQLKVYGAKATFFCVGENIQKHKEIFDAVLVEGHAVGNHTFNHIKGWKNTNEDYFENIEKSEEIYATKLFRPPYGQLKRSQGKELLKSYKIVMWSVLTRDYSSRVSPEKCLKIALNNTKEGSIVVFHDNIKAKENLYYTLPKFLKHFNDLGFKFEAL